MLSAHGRETRDLSLEDRRVNAGNPSWLTRAKRIWKRCSLVRIHLHEALVLLAAKQHRELSIGHQVKATSQQIASLRPCAHAVAKANRADNSGASLPFDGYGPATGTIGHACQLRAKSDPLEKLRRLRHQAAAKSHQTPQRGLLGDKNNLRAILLQVRCNSQQQGACASHCHPLAANVIAATDQCLQSTRSKHSGQSPAGERQKSFACASRED